jgi:hypothetical protein
MRRFSKLAGASLTILLAFFTALPIIAGQRRVSLPSGTEVKVRLDKQLDTGTAQAGEAFTGTLSEAITANGRTLFPRGARMVGRVTDAVSSGRLKKPASITLELTTISTQPVRIDGKSHLVRNAEMIGGGAAVGALVGALVGGKKGAAVGAGVGAGAGTAGAYMTGKKEIVLPAETELTFVAGTASQAATSASAPAERTSSTSRSAETSQPAASSSNYPERESRYGRVARYAEPVFSVHDREIIRDYYAESTGNLPPGLAKRHGRLPPGLERQLRKNGTLPPGLQKRVEPFPDELSRQLAPLPSGFSRVILAGRALILDRNNTILDIVALVR